MSLLKAAGDRALGATIYVNLEPAITTDALRLVLKPGSWSGESGGGHG